MVHEIVREGNNPMPVKLQTLTEATQENALRRLKSIEGQLRGLQKMVEEQRYCLEILTQLAAAQEGLRGVGKIIMRNYLENCATHAIREGKSPEIYDELMEAIYKYVR